MAAERGSEPDLASRGQSTQHLMDWLRPNPRLDGIALDVATIFWNTACDLAVILNDGQEFSAMLRKLREGKDCAVIQGLVDSGVRPG